MNQSNAGETGRMTLQRDEWCGYVYLEEGKVTHAQTGDVVGLAALYEILRSKEGDLIWEDHQEPYPHSLDCQMDSALFELARLKHMAVEGGEDDTQMPVAVMDAPAEDTQAIEIEEEDAGNESVEEPPPIPAFTLGDLAVCLKSLNGNCKDSRFYLPRGTYLFGRAKECDYVLVSPLIARFECSITVTDHSIHIVDRGSNRGISINGRRVTEGPVVPGDEIRISDAAFEISLCKDPGEEAAEDTSGKGIVHGPGRVHNLLSTRDTRSLLSWVFKKKN